MTRIYALCLAEHDKLHLWRDAPRDGGPQPTSEGVDRGLDDRGLRGFDFELDAQQHQPAHFKIHGGPEDQPYWELDEHTKTLPRTANYEFPEVVYGVEGSARVLTRDPFEAAHERVTVHLVTANKYRGGRLWYWSPGIAAQPVGASRVDEYGPVFEVNLSASQRHWFSFKFEAADGKYEPEYANRLWCSHDGAEVWVHSQASAVSSTPPVRRLLSVCTPPFIEPSQAQLHLWQQDSDFVADLDASVSQDGNLRFEALLYTDRPYEFMFRSRTGDYWEDTEARRNVFLNTDGEVWTLSGDGKRRLVSNGEVWTLDGDHELFDARPQRNQEVVIKVAARDPAFANHGPLTLDVWVNHGRTKLYQALAPDPDGSWYVQTFPEVVTSFVFRAGGAREPIERHTVKIDEDKSVPTIVYVVLGRSDALPRAPAADSFADPPFKLYRPGAWLDNGKVHFVLHCPSASCVEVVGEWTHWERRPIPLRSTRDGSFFWGQVDASSITGALGRNSIHGVGYKFLLNQRRFVQDPAADWVENSAPSSQSQLVDHGSYTWRSNGWQRPGWDYLIVYQAHPNGFAEQNHLSGFDAITRELTADDGYLRKLGATALLLLPVAEYAMDNGWGYNPSFFYAVESSYGGPDALKRLVDACHERGMAVLVDVVFNHAGTGDNALWAVASKSYFDGDTEWGAILDFDHPQVVHFFEQNLLHFMRNYRIDGFRFDFTEVIRNGQRQVPHVRVPGSGGGYDFLHKLRAAVWSDDGRCLLMAEQFPNDLGFTGPVGPMDTQWNDAFHDLLLEAAQESNVMSGLADALKATQGNGEAWYEMTNYPESHDEVGNQNHRISGQARGYRRNKVAAAATLFARGIPMWFMGAEYGEYRQFSKDSRGPITLHPGGDQARVRRWWDRLCELRRGNSRVQGPAPIDVKYAQDRMLAFTRGDNADLFVLLNFSPWQGHRSLAELNLPAGEYKELLNSTWGEYQISSEGEQDRSNGGWDARLIRDYLLNIPAFSAVVLERR